MGGGGRGRCERCGWDLTAGWTIHSQLCVRERHPHRCVGQLARIKPYNLDSEAIRTVEAGLDEEAFVPRGGAACARRSGGERGRRATHLRQRHASISGGDDMTFLLRAGSPS